MSVWRGWLVRLAGRTSTVLSLLAIIPPSLMLTWDQVDPDSRLGIALIQGAYAEEICLITAVYYEARNQPTVGQVGVLYVIDNRRRDKRFPPSYCGVVKEKKNGSKYCQFTFFCEKAIDEPVDLKAWKRSVALVNQFLSGVWSDDPTECSLWYHVADMEKRPKWAEGGKGFRIGDHFFYTQLQGENRCAVT